MGLPAAQPQPPLEELTAGPSLLDLPAAALAHIASLLQPPDRSRLAACCWVLHDQSGGWWGRLQLVLHSQEQADRLTMWLVQKRPTASVLKLECRPDVSVSLALPDSLCPCLVELSLARMQIVPASLPCSTALTRLALKSMRVEGAPRWISRWPLVAGDLLGSLTRLQQLSLENLGLKEVPAEVGALPALRSLSLRWNWELGEGLHHLAGLQHLTFLDMRQCAVGELVPDFGTLTALQRLGLSRNVFLSRGLQYLAGLTGLTSLYLSSCNVTALPPALATLTALQRLDLAGNRALASGLEHLAGLGRLSSLRLGGCSIAALPAAFAALTALEKLELNGNPNLAVGGGWEHLAGLKGLLRLDLRQCGLEGRLPTQLAGLPAACQVQL